MYGKNSSGFLLSGPKKRLKFGLLNQNTTLNNFFCYVYIFFVFYFYVFFFKPSPWHAHLCATFPAVKIYVTDDTALNSTGRQVNISITIWNRPNSPKRMSMASKVDSSLLLLAADNDSMLCAAEALLDCIFPIE